MLSCTASVVGALSGASSARARRSRANTGCGKRVDAAVEILWTRRHGPCYFRRGIHGDRRSAPCGWHLRVMPSLDCARGMRRMTEPFKRDVLPVACVFGPTAFGYSDHGDGNPALRTGNRRAALRHRDLAGAGGSLAGADCAASGDAVGPHALLRADAGRRRVPARALADPRAHRHARIPPSRTPHASSASCVSSSPLLGVVAGRRRDCARAADPPAVRLVATGGTISNRAGGRLTAEELVGLDPERAPVRDARGRAVRQHVELRPLARAVARSWRAG